MGWKPGNSQLTVDEVVADGGAITQTVVIDIATLAVKVFSDGDQVSNGGSRANIRKKLSILVFQASLSQGFQPFIHNIHLGVKVLKVGGVRETIFYVDLWIDQRSVPKAGVLLGRAETADRTGAGPRSIGRGDAGDEGG